jgi:8-oxo-dGTP diphosphatase
LMDDIWAVDWLPLDAAVERLSRAYERAFLENVGPIALESAALAQAAQRSKVRKQPVPEKRRRQPAVAPQPSPAISVAPTPAAMPSLIDTDEPLVVGNAQDIVQDASAPMAAEPASANPAAVETAQSPRINLVQKVRDWLRRAA